MHSAKYDYSQRVPETFNHLDYSIMVTLGLSAELKVASCALLETTVQNLWYLIRPESVIFFEFSRQNGASLRNYPDASHETSLPKVLHIFAAVRSSASIGQPQWGQYRP